MEYDRQDKEDKEGQENEKIDGIPKMMNKEPLRMQKITTINKRIRQTGFAEAYAKNTPGKRKTKLMTHWWACQHRQ